MLAFAARIREAFLFLLAFGANQRYNHHESAFMAAAFDIGFVDIIGVIKHI